MYLIRNFAPRTDISMGCHGFHIELPPAFKEYVARAELTQEQVDRKLKLLGDGWLDSCGYRGMFDPDNCGFDADKTAPLGPRACRSYQAGRDVRVNWGEWGPEHITVPGNACGLDIDSHAFGAFIEGAAILTPHNIDCWSQKQLLLIVFASFAEDVCLLGRSK